MQNILKLMINAKFCCFPKQVMKNKMLLILLLGHPFLNIIKLFFLRVNKKSLLGNLNNQIYCFIYLLL